MDARSVFPTLDKCPNCSAKLKNIRYGMFATPPEYDEIDGGSLVDPNSPSKACPNCDWRGGNGGRTWETSFIRTIFEPDPANASVETKRKISVDLTALSAEELIDFGKYNLPARYELVFRGLDPENVDKYYDQFDVSEAESLPLVPKETTWAYYNSSTQRIEQVSMFFAQKHSHLFQFLRPGMKDWDAAPSSMQQFHEVVFSMKKPDVTGWVIEFPDQVPEQDLVSSPDDFGSETIKAMLKGEPISREVLARHARPLARTVYWPHWFQPAFYVR